jgi:hypothetical protein
MDDLMFEAVVSEFVRPAVLTDEQLNSLHNALDDAYLHSLGPNHLLKWFTDNDFVIRHHPKPIALTPEQRAEIAAAIHDGVMSAFQAPTPLSHHVTDAVAAGTKEAVES